THAATTRKRVVTPWSDHEKLSYEKELLGFYVSGHPLDAYVDLFAGRNYQAIGALGDLEDRAQFKIAGAIVQVEKKFTRKEGKPFAVYGKEIHPQGRKTICRVLDRRPHRNAGSCRLERRLHYGHRNPCAWSSGGNSRNDRYPR